MSYVNPNLRDKFESLSIDLKNEILRRNPNINTLDDLLKCLKDISEGK